MTTSKVHDARRPEEGSVSIWLVTTGFAMIVLVGLAVDLGGQVHAQQHARAVAAQAARAGGQQLDAPAAVRGDAVRTDTQLAARAARTYLTAAGVTGNVTVTGGTTVTVDVTDTYRTTFLGVIGLSTLTVSGHGTARTTRSVGGIEQ
ncbi:MAG: pilus assembly protein [Micrococcales bacterium]|nr:pilus assembly protein [Micrococcales bacterium]